MADSASWHWMYALGRDGLPPAVRHDGVPYHLVRTLKHDFFAAVGFYESETGVRVVLKASRTSAALGIPMTWLGRWLCRRESAMYRRFADLPNVPAWLGYVGDTAFLHAYAPGAPLCRDTPVPDDFFDELRRVLTIIADRGVAYVDTNKPENILQGEDDRPYLIDWQIAWDGRHWWSRPWLGLFVKSDAYHVLKHKKRFRPDELTPEEARVAGRPRWFIRLHRTLTRPYFLVRRRLFVWLRETGRVGGELSK